MRLRAHASKPQPLPRAAAARSRGTEGAWRARRGHPPAGAPAWKGRARQNATEACVWETKRDPWRRVASRTAERTCWAKVTRMLPRDAASRVARALSSRSEGRAVACAGSAVASAAASGAGAGSAATYLAWGAWVEILLSILLLAGYCVTSIARRPDGVRRWGRSMREPAAGVRPAARAQTMAISEVELRPCCGDKGGDGGAVRVRRGRPARGRATRARAPP
mmetsp:Transcript_4568/g.15163  ORF Transcript_4568/g.15163 Transcript_4568/m.15163 type:complete len:222 (-) Transcript_4568:65-730(-)